MNDFFYALINLKKKKKKKKKKNILFSCLNKQNKEAYLAPYSHLSLFSNRKKNI